MTVCIHAPTCPANWLCTLQIVVPYIAPVSRDIFGRYSLQLDSKYGLLTKCEVKMAGYWPSSFFACLWTETKSKSINSQKKNEANIHLHQRVRAHLKGVSK